MLSCLTAGLVSPAQAGVIVGATRVIYPEQANEASFSIKDADTAPFVVQAWADSADGKRAFFVTPPLSRLDPGKQNVLRVMRGSQPLPADRESMTWLNVKEIPETPSKQNVLQIAVRTRIKLFYRPDNLAGDPADAPQQLQWHVQSAPDGKGQVLHIHNPTPYYVTFASLKAEGAHTAALDKLEYVQPFGDAQAPLAHAISGQPLHVTYSTINDFGAFSQPVSVNVSS